MRTLKDLVRVSERPVRIMGSTSPFIYGRHAPLSAFASTPAHCTATDDPRQCLSDGEILRYVLAMSWPSSKVVLIQSRHTALSERDGATLQFYI